MTCREFSCKHGGEYECSMDLGYCESCEDCICYQDCDECYHYANCPCPEQN